MQVQSAYLEHEQDDNVQLRESLATWRLEDTTAKRELPLSTKDNSPKKQNYHPSNSEGDHSTAEDLKKKYNLLMRRAKNIPRMEGMP